MKHKFLKALTLVLAATAFAPAAQAETQAEIRARINQDTISSLYLADVKRSVSAYFNTLNIKNEQVKEGLTIPWVSMTPREGWFGSKYVLSVEGFAVATGKTAPNGCPAFKVVAFDHVGKDTRRFDGNFTICP